MRKICLLVDECTPGMRLAADVNNAYGVTIATKGTYIDERLFEKLILNNVDLIFVYDGNNEGAGNYEKMIFKENYEANAKQFKHIMESLKNGRKINIEIFQGVSHELFSMLNNITTGNIFNYLKIMKEKDDYTYTHCINVSILCMILGKWLRLPPDEVMKIGLSGLMHDIGKAYIPSQILNKAGKLTEAEYCIAMRHAELGFKYISQIDRISDSIASGVLMHHEREDGSGYPYGHKGDKIHLFGKILAVCDSYDAMTADRIYHKAESPFKVIEMLQCKSFEYFDTNVLYTFLNNIALYYIGDEVKLSTGQKGNVCFINPFNVSRPIVKVNNDYVDLSINMDLCIEALEESEYVV